MKFNEHYNLREKHAFLSASSYHWLNYDEAKLVERWSTYTAAQEGTRLHAFAAECISLGQRLPKAQKTLNLYVNDAIGYKMEPEQILYYSDNCFGTADTICFRKDRSGNYILRIHDLKTGITPAHMEQLEIYNALFCLEYKHKPNDIIIEDRIYQSDQVFVHNPDPSEISKIMSKIITFDKILNELKKSEE